MTEYKKKIYLLEHKSRDGIQHYGFIICIDGTPSIRQWHKPRAMGYVFMGKEEANEEADTMIIEFNKKEGFDITKELKAIKHKVLELEGKI